VLSLYVLQLNKNAKLVILWKW